ncbi:MAG: hypothetical protein JSS66_06950 [Armatimonadetes bacterium]|nr:hypothetical protein [Armatimonadota bacterium]
MPVHESIMCVLDQAANWRRFAPLASLVFHVSQVASYSPQELDAMVKRANPNAYVNEERLMTGWADGTLLCTHWSNFCAAEDSGLVFERFAIDASNTLLVRPGLEEHMMKGKAGYNVPVPVRKEAKARPCYSDIELNLRTADYGVVPCEGLWFDADMFRGVLEEACNLSGAYATEEVYPVALWELAHGKDFRCAGNYILTPFESNLHVSEDDITAIHYGFHRNEDLFGVKRAPREYDHPIRRLLRKLGKY